MNCNYTIFKGIIFFGTIFLFLFSIADAQAAVSGPCANCHTMHDSEQSLTMKLDTTPITGSGVSECYDCHAAQRRGLLRMDCIGCHVQGYNDPANIVSNTPQVAHNAGTDLAGGNFRHVFADDANGHNVHGFPSGAITADSTLLNTPPGYSSSFDPSTNKYQPGYGTGQIMCAGQNGCHGDREEVSQTVSLRGAHHYNDSVLQYGAGFNEASQGTTVGNSYRFLYKVKGAEDDDWEDTVGNTDHNEYRGLSFNLARSSQNWADIESMSTFCAECHGIFHSGSDMQSSNVWIRHPSDAIMPNSTPYSDYTVYDPVVPVAKQSIAAGTTQASGTVVPGSDIVFCLSCHRAHGSPYTSMLRWDYDTCKGSDANCGCYTCHTDKD